VIHVRSTCLAVAVVSVGLAACAHGVVERRSQEKVGLSLNVIGVFGDALMYQLVFENHGDRIVGLATPGGFIASISNSAGEVTGGRSVTTDGSCRHPGSQYWIMPHEHLIVMEKDSVRTGDTRVSVVMTPHFIDQDLNCTDQWVELAAEATFPEVVEPSHVLTQASQIPWLDEKTGRVRMVATADELADAERELRQVRNGYVPRGGKNLGTNTEEEVLFDGVVAERLGDDAVGQPRWRVHPEHFYFGRDLLGASDAVVTSPTIADGGVALVVGARYRLVAAHLFERFYVWRMGVLGLQTP